jgi:AcrR family transcriptional regulator
MARPKLSQQIDLQEAIKETALNQIAENGAASLSLRAIARALNITAPAIYNHYPNRDELVTSLIIDAYTSLGDWQFAALEGQPAGDHAGRLRALGLAYRDWAVAYPQRYLLIFGSPIPGYHCPPERSMPAAARSLSALIGVLEAARLSDQLQPEEAPYLPDPLRQQLTAWQALHPAADVYVLYLALVIWSRVHGLVMFEIDNQYPPFVKDPDQIFYREVTMIVHQYLR